MSELVREENYVFWAGTKRYVLRAEELVWGAPAWPEKFRVQVREPNTRDAQMFYGTTAREAVERTIEYLWSRIDPSTRSEFSAPGSQENPG